MRNAAPIDRDRCGVLLSSLDANKPPVLLGEGDERSCEKKSELDASGEVAKN